METPRWINGVEPPAHLLHASGTQILEIECREQPQRLLDLIRAYRSDPELRSQLKNFRELSQKPGPVMFIGMGASYCSSFSASVVLTDTRQALLFRGCRRMAALRSAGLERCGSFRASHHLRRKCRTGRVDEDRREPRARPDLQ